MKKRVLKRSKALKNTKALKGSKTSKGLVRVIIFKAKKTAVAKKAKKIARHIGIRPPPK